MRLEGLKGQAHDVRVRAGDVRDDWLGLFLDGVSTGFVEGIDVGEIAAYLDRIEVKKRDSGAFSEKFLAMLTAVKLWAAAHLLANGDLGSIILFGSFLAWAVYDRISLKHRSDPGAPPIPVGGWTNDAVAVVVGTLVYLAVGFVFHPLAGLPVFGR